MKWIQFSILAVVVLVFSSVQAGPAVSGGGSPFVYSSSVLQTIFSSPMVWNKIFGGIEKLTLIEQNQKSATYQISTTETVAIKNAQGTIVRWDRQACETVITVTNVSNDVVVPQLKITNADFSKCPSVSL